MHLLVTKTNELKLRHNIRSIISDKIAGSSENAADDEDDDQDTKPLDNDILACVPSSTATVARRSLQANVQTATSSGIHFFNDAYILLYR